MHALTTEPAWDIRLRGSRALPRRLMDPMPAHCVARKLCRQGLLRVTLIVMKRTHPESCCRTSAVDTYVDDGVCSGPLVDHVRWYQALPRAHNLLRMENPTWSQRHDCYEPGVTALRETNLNPMNSQPQQELRRIIQEHDIRLENTYNTDETGRL